MIALFLAAALAGGMGPLGREDARETDRALELQGAAARCDLVLLRREQARLLVKLQQVDFEAPRVKYRIGAEYRVVASAIARCGVSL